MNYFERIMLSFLQSGKIKVEISGFDMEGFKHIVNQALKWRLELIESIIFEDADIMPDAEKIATIKELFQCESYTGE